MVQQLRIQDFKGERDAPEALSERKFPNKRLQRYKQIP